MIKLIKDPFFTVDVISKTPNPQKVCYADMHTCYSENYATEEFFADEQFYNEPDSEKLTWLDPFNPEKELTEKQAGDRVVKHCLRQKHWGVIEGPAITFGIGYFPHSLMQQARTHRIGVTFNVQSGRYTGKRIIDVADGNRSVEEVFYLRPVGDYSNRQGKKYSYTEEARKEDLDFCFELAKRYKTRYELGFSEEHIRDVYSNYCLRQHFTVSFNIRSLFHFLDMRSTADAELEIQTLCHLMCPHVQRWIPQIFEYYAEKRLGKNQLAP